MTTSIAIICKLKSVKDREIGKFQSNNY